MVWLLLAFDLPVKTKAQRKAAAQFRFKLLDDGFEMTQYSVYLRYCGSKNVAAAHIKRITRRLPNRGKVDILQFTDAQYENIVSFDNRGRKIRKTEPQYQLF
ncbi:CRISPR-associated endonuclease Cas2 [Candidatus Seongchinamella marina]|uniref:CRISPR-associated endonuclease Cas2 n=1 Tax=Candidatus Seongchinamella marina TaxID=2518990 RepID=UPI00242B3007|nr:CRISPR-associated endonuclease Cas2 [Candidatus Seongchinamella marina]